MTKQGPIGIEFFSPEAHAKILASVHCGASAREVLRAAGDYDAVVRDHKWAKGRGLKPRPFEGGGVSGKELVLPDFGAKLVVADWTTMRRRFGRLLFEQGERVAIGFRDAGTLELVLDAHKGVVVRLDNGERWFARSRVLTRTRVFLDY